MEEEEEEEEEEMRFILKSLMFSVMLMGAYRDQHIEIRLTCRTDSHIVNSWLMQASTRLTTTIYDLPFADD
nr:unnamed protein product [Spirometra erinaceieuropaei]